MALLASAEERETRGLTSIILYSKLFGSSANWTLQPPCTPSASTMFMAAVRSMPNSTGESVTAGATTMLSPVWMPTGSTFSMEHIVMMLPAPSRMTSNSISFQPATLCSTRTWCIGEARRPFSQISRSSSRVPAMPPPVPPSVNAGRMMSGRPTSSANAMALSTSVTTVEGMTGWPMAIIVSLNICLSSALSIVSGSAPSRRTCILSRKPSFASCIESVRPFCPPSVLSRLSGRSFSMMRRSTGRLSGSMYILSAIAPSVIMVAGLEFTSTVVMPSAFSTLHAWAPA